MRTAGAILPLRGPGRPDSDDDMHAWPPPSVHGQAIPPLCGCEVL